MPHDILGSNEVVDDTMNMIQPLFGSGPSVDMGGIDNVRMNPVQPVTGHGPSEIVIGGPQLDLADGGDQGGAGAVA
ncbi:MAG: hypothetical protein M3548_12200 [Actinomycetota bacterium]|nr:hypothetical protein [Actinomycetota bacterium]